jgi:hypothetical protein
MPDSIWEYVVWIDAHQIFSNPYWWEEFIIKAEKSAIIQIFQSTNRLDDKNITWPSQRRGVIYQSTFSTDVDSLGFSEIGNAYGMRKAKFKEMKYIADECIATCCDCIFIRAFLKEKITFEDGFLSNYFRQFNTWLVQTREVLNWERDFVRGVLHHIYHPVIPYYDKLQGLFLKENFDLSKGLSRDENGTLFLTNATMKIILKELIENLIPHT